MEESISNSMLSRESNVAQLDARLTGDQEVAGLTPANPITRAD